MWKRVWLGLLVIGLETGIALGQEFLDDQFRLELPGLSVTVFQDLGSSPCGIESPWNSFLCESIDELQGQVGGMRGHGSDVLGSIKYQYLPPISEDYCLVPWSGPSRNATFDLVRRTPAGIQLVARIPQCVKLGRTETGAILSQSTFLAGLDVDINNGHLYVGVRSFIRTSSEVMETSYGIIRISGLPTLLDIIPTFQPANETLSWVTPKHPEALPAADNFQVYAGAMDDLRQDRDFTSAVPIDCTVPDVGPPAPGDYLSILDPLNPMLGKVEYALVGVEYQGRQRFGRQNSGGTLTGREPTLFPSCS